MMSPVAKRTAVVTAWVRTGREASLAWYLWSRVYQCVVVGGLVTLLSYQRNILLTRTMFHNEWQDYSSSACARRVE
jgi:hypothetical protein